jgi:hypothetical protein
MILSHTNLPLAGVYCLLYLCCTCDLLVHLLSLHQSTSKALLMAMLQRLQPQRLLHATEGAGVGGQAGGVAVQVHLPLLVVLHCRQPSWMVLAVGSRDLGRRCWLTSGTCIRMCSGMLAHCLLYYMADLLTAGPQRCQLKN